MHQKRTLKYGTWDDGKTLQADVNGNESFSMKVLLRINVLYPGYYNNISLIVFLNVWTRKITIY